MANKPSGPNLGGLTNKRIARELGKDIIFTELGTVGLDISGGRIRESRLQNFKGTSRAKVIREMSETDAIVKGLLSNYTMLAMSAERVVSGTNEEAVEFVESCLDDMETSWPDTLSAIMSMLPFGFSYHEVNYKTRNGMNPDAVPEVDPHTGEMEEVEPPPSKHDDGKIGWWGWPIRLQETIDRWDAPKGRVRGAYQRAKSFQQHEVYLPIEKALLFRTSAKRGNPEGESMLESAYRSWYFKRNFEELLGVGVKRDLTGLLTMSVPKEWNIWQPSGETKRAELEDLVANVQRDEYEGLVHPDDVEPKLLSSGGSRQFDIIQVIRNLWLEIALATLTDFALIGHEQIGARSLKEESTRMFMIALQGILDNIADVVNRFAIPRLMELNGFSEKELPELKFSTVDVPRIEEIIDALTKLTQAGAEVFPNAEVMEMIFSSLRLPVEEMGEKLEDDIERREEMLKNNPLMDPSGKDEDEDEGNPFEKKKKKGDDDDDEEDDDDE